jgi:hypothetical protein
MLAKPIEEGTPEPRIARRRTRVDAGLPIRAQGATLNTVLQSSSPPSVMPYGLPRQSIVGPQFGKLGARGKTGGSAACLAERLSLSAAE